MQSLTFAVLAALLTGLSARQSPSPAPQDDPNATPTVSGSARAANKKVLAQMQGAWRLVDMQLVDQKAPKAPPEAIEHVGFCLVSGNYLSIELHIGILGGNSQTVARSFVSGMHRFEFDVESNIETSSMIGTSADIRGKTAFEQPGTKRHYRVEVAGNSMTLRRDDGHTLVFERMLDDRTRLDVYGRPIKEKKDADKDGTKDDGKKDSKPDDKKPDDSGKDGGG